MPKELFNQPLIESPSVPAEDDRFAFGQPSVSGGFDIKWSYLKQLIQGIGEFYGEMYFYESSGSQAVVYVNQYYGINGEFEEGDLSNFTFHSGSVGAGNTTSANGGAAINVYDVAHGLITGDYVAVQSIDHNGIGKVTKIDDDNFTVPITYNSDDPITWQQGDYLLAGAGSDAKYRAFFSITTKAGEAAKNFKFELVQNDTEFDKAAFEITTSGLTPQSSGSSGLITIVEGDRIWAIFENNTDATDLDYVHANINLYKL